MELGVIHAANLKIKSYPRHYCTASDILSIRQRKAFRHRVYDNMHFGDAFFSLILTQTSLVLFLGSESSVDHGPQIHYVVTPRIRDRSELTEKAWENTGRGQGKSTASDRFSRNNVTKDDSADL